LVPASLRPPFFNLLTPLPLPISTLFLPFNELHCIPAKDSVQQCRLFWHVLPSPSALHDLRHSFFVLKCPLATLVFYLEIPLYSTVPVGRATSLKCLNVNRSISLASILDFSAFHPETTWSGSQAGLLIPWRFCP